MFLLVGVVLLFFHCFKVPAGSQSEDITFIVVSLHLHC